MQLHPLCNRRYLYFLWRNVNSKNYYMKIKEKLVKSRLKTATSVKNISKLLKIQFHLKHELKTMYSQLQVELETKVVKDIEQVCMELSNSSAPGPDGIPTILLKNCRRELKKPIYILWKASMNQGIIPPDLLSVTVSPIHKGGSRVDLSNYRPVALTSHLIKVFERVLRRALVIHLEGLDYLPQNQHGFREQRSTLTQLLSHWDSVLDKLEQDIQK